MNELMKKVAEKHGIEFEILEKIIDCERKHVHKDRRPINGDLKTIIEQATKKKEEGAI